ncbi:MAG: acyl-CoA dehydrogenase family protein [Actinomycetota bacterium]
MNETTPIGQQAAEWFDEHWDPVRPLGEWWRDLADSGFAFPQWPEGLGGRGLSPSDAKAVQHARRVAGAYGPPNGVATFLVAPTLLTMGSAEQQQRYLPGIVDGTTPWCQLFSEPSAGSDMASLGTRATRDGHEWRVDGQKVWNSGAHYADYGILIARTDPELPKHRGVTYFLIDMRQPGVEVQPLREMTGDAAFNEVFFTDARVHDDDRVGAEGDGWRVAMTTLSFERDPNNAGLGDTAAFYEADLSVPVGEHARAEAAAADGFSIAMAGRAGEVFESAMNHGTGDGPVMRDRRAQLAAQRAVMGWSSRRATASMKAGRQPGPEVATLKIGGAETGRQIRDLGLEALGAEGMLWADDAPDGGLFHRYAMFTPASSIAGGTDEVLRNSIGERVLGLPREPDETERRKTPWNELRRS